MSKLAALAVMLTVGCALEDTPGKDLCVTEANCLSGHRCVEGHCVSGVAPDAGVDAPDQDAPVPLDGPPAPLDGPSSEPSPAELPPADTGPPDVPADAAPARCGNGVREGLEACDRGEAGDDFCDGQCRWKRPPQLSTARYHTCLRTGDDRIAC